MLSLVCSKISKIDSTLHDETLGINTHLTTVQTQADNNTTTLHSQKLSLEKTVLKTDFTNLKEDVTAMKSENTVLRGIVQCQHGQIKALNDKVAYLTKKSMENNLIITGLEGDLGKKENCTKNVIQFFKEKVKIEVEESEILVAHRSGKSTPTSTRNMIVRCTILLKEKILQNAKNLKDIKNSMDQPYWINKQLQDVMVEQGLQIREKIKSVKDQESSLPYKERSKIEVKDGMVHINGEISKTNHLLPIQPLDLFLTRPEKQKWNLLKMLMSDVKSERGSNFIAMVVKVSQFADVKRAYRKARSLYPAANHLVAAYKLKNGYEGFQDDLEYGAGHRLLKALKAMTPLSGTAVFVARTYDGSHIGPIRHELFADTMKQAVNRLEKQQQLGLPTTATIHKL